ncbi:MAG: hypothetical protein KC462_00530, partial [Cyanobacteria bacterium HKST-UBA05]|nr:hypothetical protein [Cyanobacteria bacterium HKST-UBA05]
GGADTLTGGTGTDTLDYSADAAGVTINLSTNSASGGDAAGDTISGFENVIGGTGDDTLSLNGHAADWNSHGATSTWQLMLNRASRQVVSAHNIEHTLVEE